MNTKQNPNTWIHASNQCLLLAENILERAYAMSLDGNKDSPPDMYLMDAIQNVHMLVESAIALDDQAKFHSYPF